MSLYQVIRKTNRWNRQGNPIDVREYVRMETDDVIAAMRMVMENPTPWNDAVMTKWFVRRVADGSTVRLLDIYEDTVGAALVAAQLESEDFGMKLEPWFQATFMDVAPTPTITASLDFTRHWASLEEALSQFDDRPRPLGYDTVYVSDGIFYTRVIRMDHEKVICDRILCDGVMIDNPQPHVKA